MKKALALLLALVMLLGLGAVAYADGVTLNVVTSYGGDDGNRGNSTTAPPPPTRSGRPRS